MPSLSGALVDGWPFYQKLTPKIDVVCVRRSAANDRQYDLPKLSTRSFFVSFIANMLVSLECIRVIRRH